jgi:hypothetical protein
MKTFNVQHELSQIIESKQLVEIDLEGVDQLIYAYILKANEEYITIAVINLNGMLTGVTMCRFTDVNLFSTGNNYSNELTKLIDADSIYRQTDTAIEKIDRFTFEGIAAYLEDSRTVAMVTRDNQENIVGRLAGFDDEYIVIDEYVGGRNSKLARTYFPITDISQITISTALLNATNNFLAENNI